MRISLALVFLLFSFSSPSHADTLYEFMVGGTIKNLARIYVITSDLPKLKAKYVRKLEGMRQDRFEKNYRKFYAVFVHLPLSIREGYDFRPNTGKQELIAAINHVSKRDLIAIINRIPSAMIVHQARHYASPPKTTVDEMFFWHHLIEKI